MASLFEHPAGRGRGVGTLTKGYSVSAGSGNGHRIADTCIRNMAISMARIDRFVFVFDMCC